MNEERPEVKPVNRWAGYESHQVASGGLKHVLSVLPGVRAPGRAVRLTYGPASIRL
jgi:hypothetical protein